MFRIGDKIKSGKLEGHIIAITMRGGGYREYDCILISPQGEPSRYLLTKYDIKPLENKEGFGFNAGKR